MDIEGYHKRNIAIYLEDGKTGRANGVVHMQRICRIGYNQACHTIEYGIKIGVLKRDSDIEYLHWIISSGTPLEGSGNKK